ncbi:hypothetical protein K4F52_001815 [Lecanicillium sp. MT-2017a]|nr:hypothetical protein K4F52_001815 [Lecanicillium sp. MT-2017a]
MPPSKLPVENSTTSVWRSSLHPLDDHQSTPELPTDVDIAIIGAGFSGASTAYHILNICKKNGTPIPKTAILEARQACSGATGRNGGHMKPDLYSRPSILIKSHGVEAAAEWAAFEAENLKAVKKIIEDEGIDCDFVLTRAVDALMTDAAYRKTKAAVELLRKAEVPGIDDLYVATSVEAERLSGVHGVKGCITYTTGQLYPYKLVMHMLSKAVEAGVNLQTHTPVTEVTPAHDTNGYLTITSSRGTVRTKNIVYATNGYTSSIVPEFTDKIVPVRGICSHIKPGKTPVPPLPNSYIIRSSDLMYEYLIPKLDGSIVVGGARQTYYHDLDCWYNNVNDDALLEPAKTYFDGYMQRTFHGWEDSDAETAKVWTGVMGYSSDARPHVGAVPGRKHQFILGGFSGHGMPLIFLSAKGVASMVMKQQTFENTGVPSAFAASQARLDSAQNTILESWEASQQRKQV